MAKAWAREFYKSRAWRAARQQALVRDGYTCEYCGARATEVHHDPELTPDNIRDPEITLGLSHLHSLCHTCHTSITPKGGGVAGDCADGLIFGADGVLTPPGGR